jgi:NOL1/NOP2/sun family putative RNA methylase
MWSLRVNTLKISVEDFKKRMEGNGWEFEQIPWIKEGFWVSTDVLLSKTKEHSLGYYFLQDASSMIPPLVLDPKPNGIVLDLAASPGAKTTEMAAMMKNTGVIIANDIRHERLKALRGNLQRCGVLNAVVTKMWGETVWKSGLKFSKILLDAPCTATGTMNPRILAETSQSSIHTLSTLQKRLIESASKLLSDHGTLVYSTCSLEKEENEENMEYAVENLNLKTEPIEVKGLEYSKTFENCVRIKPSDRQEGFFVCKLEH